MTFDSIKQSVYTAILHHSVNNTNENELDDETFEVNKIITGALVINAINTLVNSNDRFKGNISELAQQYTETYSNIVESLQKKYVTYKLMRRTIQDYKLPSFMAISQKQVNQIIALYNAKKERLEFNTLDFSHLMYDVQDISDQQYNQLSKVHYRVICPIVKYYMRIKDGMTFSDVAVESENYDVPSKVINLAITGIQPQKIFADLSAGRLAITQFLYSYTLTADGFVRLVIK